jgi:hypothetical protein
MTTLSDHPVCSIGSKRCGRTPFAKPIAGGDP